MHNDLHIKTRPILAFWCFGHVLLCRRNLKDGWRGPIVGRELAGLEVAFLSHKALLPDKGNRRLAGQGSVWGKGLGFSANFSLTLAIRGPMNYLSIALLQADSLYPLSLHRCFSHAMVGSFQRTAIHKLETTQMTSNWGNIRQITVHSEDGIFHNH